MYNTPSVFVLVLLHLWQTSSLVWNYCTLGWPRGPPPLQTWGYRILEKHPCIFVLYHEIFFLPWRFVKIFYAYNAGGNHFDGRLLDQVLGPLWIYLPAMNGWRRPWIWFESFFNIKCLKWVCSLSFRCQPSNIVLSVSNIKYEITNVNYCLPTIFSVPVTEKRALRMSWKYSLFTTS